MLCQPHGFISGSAMSTLVDTPTASTRIADFCVDRISESTRMADFYVDKLTFINGLKTARRACGARQQRMLETPTTNDMLTRTTSSSVRTRRSIPFPCSGPAWIMRKSPIRRNASSCATTPAQLPNARKLRGSRAGLNACCDRHRTFHGRTSLAQNRAIALTANVIWRCRVKSSNMPRTPKSNSSVSDQSHRNSGPIRNRSSHQGRKLSPNESA